VYDCIKQFVTECLIVLVILFTISFYFPIFVLPYFDEQFLDDPFGNSGQTVLDPKSNPTATQLNFNQSNRIRLSLNPKRPDDGSVKGVSPLPQFLRICTTISGHDLFASPINKNVGCP
jgi:hypothetical protein